MHIHSNYCFTSPVVNLKDFGEYQKKVAMATAPKHCEAQWSPDFVL